MNPKTTLQTALVISAVGLVPALASAQAAPVVSSPGSFSGWHAGASAFHISGLDVWDDDVGFGARVGHLFAPSGGGTFRHGPQLDLAYASFDGEEGGLKGELDLTMLMANYVVGGAVSEAVFLFGGGGAGITFAEASAQGVGSAEDTASSWQVFFGVEWQLTDLVSLRGAYRHFWLDDLSDQGFTVEGDDASVIEGGVTFWF